MELGVTWACSLPVSLAAAKVLFEDSVPLTTPTVASHAHVGGGGQRDSLERGPWDFLIAVAYLIFEIFILIIILITCMRVDVGT